MAEGVRRLAREPYQSKANGIGEEVAGAGPDSRTGWRWKWDTPADPDLVVNTASAGSRRLLHLTTCPLAKPDGTSRLRHDISPRQTPFLRGEGGRLPECRMASSVRSYQVRPR
jgi:hypothetical protein